MHRQLVKEFTLFVALIVVLASPAAFTLAQTDTRANPIADLPNLLKATPGVLGIELARTASGKQVIFAWFENKKAALAWYYSDGHQQLMKMGGGGARPGGPMADIPDDGRPILAIASITLPAGQQGPPTPNALPAVPQIAIELYAPLPGGLAAGGRFAPAGMIIPGFLEVPSPVAEGGK